MEKHAGKVIRADVGNNRANDLWMSLGQATWHTISAHRVQSCDDAIEPLGDPGLRLIRELRHELIMEFRVGLLVEFA